MNEKATECSICGKVLGLTDCVVGPDPKNIFDTVSIDGFDVQFCSVCREQPMGLKALRVRLNWKALGKPKPEQKAAEPFSEQVSKLAAEEQARVEHIERGHSWPGFSQNHVCSRCKCIRTVNEQGKVVYTVDGVVSSVPPVCYQLAKKVDGESTRGRAKTLGYVLHLPDGTHKRVPGPGTEPGVDPAKDLPPVPAGVCRPLPSPPLGWAQSNGVSSTLTEEEAKRLIPMPDLPPTSLPIEQIVIAQQRDRFKARAEQAEEDLSVAKTQVADLQRANQVQGEDIKFYIGQRDALDAKVAELEAQLKKEQASPDDSHEVYTTAYVSCEAYREVQSALTSSINEREELRARLEKVQDDCDAFYRTMTTMSVSCEAYQEVQRQLALMTSERDDLKLLVESDRENVTKLQDQLSFKVTECTGLARACDLLTESLNSLGAKVKEVDGHANTLQEFNADLEAENTRCALEITELEKERDSVIAKKAVVEEKCVELTREREGYKHQYQIQGEYVDELEQTKASLQYDIAQRDAHILRMEEANGELHEKIKGLKKELKTVTADRNQLLGGEADNLRTKAGVLELEAKRVHDDLNRATQDIRFLNGKNTELAIKLDELNDEHAFLQVMHNGVQAHNTSLETQVKLLQQEIDGGKLGPPITASDLDSIDLLDAQQSTIEDLTPFEIVPPGTQLDSRDIPKVLDESSGMMNYNVGRDISTDPVKFAGVPHTAPVVHPKHKKPRW